MKTLSAAPSTPGLTRHTYPAIDVLRGMAALLVLVFHVIHVGKWTSFPTHGPLLLFHAGWMGVNIFLVISGFVITSSALTGFERNGSGFRAPFAVNRLARIIPLYLLTCAVYLICTQPEWLHDPRSTLIHVGSHLAFIHNLHHTTHGSINGPAWTIGLEMQFYVLVLCITPWFARTWGLKALALVVLGAALIRYAITLLLIPGQAAVPILVVYTTQLPAIIEHFALGASLALVVRHSPSMLALRLAPTWKNWAAWTTAAIVLFTLLIQLLWLKRHLYWSSTAMIVGIPTLLAFICTVLLGSALSCPFAHTRLLEPLRYLGRISYGVYLWHMPVLLLIIARAPEVRGLSLLATVLLCTLLLSAASWHFLERPLIDRFRRNSRPRTPSAQSDIASPKAL